jgi:hypothetical protein
VSPRLLYLIFSYVFGLVHELLIDIYFDDRPEQYVDRPGSGQQVLVLIPAVGCSQVRH